MWDSTEPRYRLNNGHLEWISRLTLNQMMHFLNCILYFTFECLTNLNYLKKINRLFFESILLPRGLTRPTLRRPLLQGIILWVPNCLVGPPKCEKWLSENINLIEIAWLPWQPIMQFSRMGMYLQNYCTHILAATYPRLLNLVLN